MSPLPEELARVIARKIEPFSMPVLTEAAQSLSTGYRSRDNIRHTLSPLEVAAYLGSRFPSTYAVASRVWDEVATRLGGLKPDSVLDAGAGPGTAAWAGARHLADASCTLLERDPAWGSVASECGAALGVRSQFTHGDIQSIGTSRRFDVVVACYSLNELAADGLENGIGRLWDCTGGVLIVIEPGTPLGFEVVRRVRGYVIAHGGTTISPCTHDAICPMTDKDWCHFPERMQRSSIQRLLKKAELGYEDEKFSYIALSKAPVAPRASGRILRKPIRAKGHVHLDSCERGSIVRHTISRKQGGLYRAAKEIGWGDLWPTDVE